MPPVQVVPVPDKYHVPFRESPDLQPASLLLLALQTNVQSQLRLVAAMQLATLYKKERRLCEALTIDPVVRPRCRHFDRAGRRGNLEDLGSWFGSSLNFCLYSQGPYCAALLLKVGTRLLLLTLCILVSRQLV